MLFLLTSAVYAYPKEAKKSKGTTEVSWSDFQVLTESGGGLGLAQDPSPDTFVTEQTQLQEQLQQQQQSTLQQQQQQQSTLQRQQQQQSTLQQQKQQQSTLQRQQQQTRLLQEKQQNDKEQERLQKEQQDKQQKEQKEQQEKQQKEQKSPAMVASKPLSNPNTATSQPPTPPPALFADKGQQETYDKLKDNSVQATDTSKVIVIPLALVGLLLIVATLVFWRRRYQRQRAADQNDSFESLVEARKIQSRISSLKVDSFNQSSLDRNDFWVQETNEKVDKSGTNNNMEMEMDGNSLYAYDDAGHGLNAYYFVPPTHNVPATDAVPPTHSVPATDAVPPTDDGIDAVRNEVETSGVNIEQAYADLEKAFASQRTAVNRKYRFSFESSVNDSLSRFQE